MAALLSLSLCLFTLCIADTADDTFVLDNYGAWLSCRKVVQGVNGVFGKGYSFSVGYELTNIGTQTAYKIKIDDNWDWSFVSKRSGPSSDPIHYELDQLKVGATASFHYYLTPLQYGTTYPTRANLTYFNGDPDGDDEEFTEIHGMSSNFIVSNDGALQNEGLFKWNDDNSNNDRLVVLNRSMYSRATSTTIIHWFVFVLLCGIAIAYPLVEYQVNGGDLNALPYSMGPRVRKYCIMLNDRVVVRVKTQIEKMKGQKTETAEQKPEEKTEGKTDKKE